MMPAAKTIWKYPLEVVDEQTLYMPLGAQILHVALQGASVALWAQVDSERPKAPRVIKIWGTGHRMPEQPGRYIGTFMLSGGGLVFHAYEDA